MRRTGSLLFAPRGFCFSQTNKEIAVHGNCGMCQFRIESTAMKVPGVDTAIWYPSADSLYVKFLPDADGEGLMKIVCLNIVNAGHDNSYYAAPDSSYNALHGCCKYERPYIPKNYCDEHPFVRNKKAVNCTQCGKKLIR